MAPQSSGSEKSIYKQSGAEESQEEKEEKKAQPKAQWLNLTMQEISYLGQGTSLSCKNPKALPIFRKSLALVCFSKVGFIHPELQRIKKEKLSWDLLVDITAVMDDKM